MSTVILLSHRSSLLLLPSSLNNSAQAWLRSDCGEKGIQIENIKIEIFPLAVYLIVHCYVEHWEESQDDA